VKLDLFNCTFHPNSTSLVNKLTSIPYENKSQERITKQTLHLDLPEEINQLRWSRWDSVFLSCNSDSVVPRYSVERLESQDRVNVNFTQQLFGWTVVVRSSSNFEQLPVVSSINFIK
jgi:hypothetical protein